MRPADELKATDSDTMSTHFRYKQFFLIFLCKETCSALMFQQLSLLWFAASKDTHVTAAAKKIGNADQLFVNIKLLLLLTTCTHIQYVRGCMCVLLKWSCYGDINSVCVSFRVNDVACFSGVSEIIWKQANCLLTTSKLHRDPRDQASNHPAAGN